MAATMKWFASMIGVCCCLKILLIPAYRSTDFEVHRNWLAITHSVPVSDWYFEETSQWTLDYPPFFASFEYALSHVAELFDTEMLILNNLEYASKATIVFQRLSVVFTDLMLVFAVYQFITKSLHESEKGPSLSSKSFIFAILIVFNFGLLVVDHIHFQYNGFLFGFLLLSITKMTEGKMLQGAFLFAVLLNFKHIFLYIAPAYFIYLLREYCFLQMKRTSGFAKLLGVNIGDLKPVKLLGLGIVVLSVFLVSFGPFIWLGDVGQVLSRLFPVKRGLCHAYWAANFWSFYNLGDKLLLIVGSKLGMIDSSTRASMTGGLVAQQEHIVLPSISAVTTAVTTVLTMMIDIFTRNAPISTNEISMFKLENEPSLLHAWYKPSGPKGFIRCLLLCAYCSFLFGYHVHEKAIIMIIIPMCTLVVQSKRDCRAFLLLSIPGNFALFPLLYQSFETPLKVTLYLAYTIFSYMALAKLHSISLWNLGLPFLNKIEALYIWGLVPLYIYCNIIHSAIGLDSRLPFIPLMLTSVYCTVGVLWSWILFYRDSLLDENEAKKTKQSW